MQRSSQGDFSLPSGPNMHASASSSKRKPSWQSQRLSSMRSGRSGHASSRASTSSVNQRESARDEPRRTSTTSAQSSQPKWWRVRLFRGMIKDVKRRAPYYWSDWADAWDYRIVPATVYMYFAKYDFSIGHFTPLFPLSLPSDIWP
jgi:hypothetical protein